LEEKKIGRLIELVRKGSPLVHHITNYVTTNDCANITLGIGASPVMADEAEEMSDITGIANALVLNIGTINRYTASSMIVAGKVANEKGIPVVLDPVGVGASELRRNTTNQILNEVKVSVLRGNISEIRFIAGLTAVAKGVDASDEDISSNESREEVASQLASRLDCIVVISGKVDVISDGLRTVQVRNGHAMIGEITGTGCMCSSLIGSFSGVNPDDIFNASVAAMVVMGIAGEKAYKTAGELGRGSFRVALHDEISRTNKETIEGLVRIDEK
jgi:hydroxyethylthiazole kinase